METGFPTADTSGVPRREFDPAQRTLAQREAAKAAELAAAGQAVSVTTVRRMRARYRREGLWGLVDQRATRRRSPLGRADERVVAAIVQALEEQRERSTGTLSRLRRSVGWILDETYGAGMVTVPPVATFNRLVHALADGKGLLGTAAQRRSHASRPAAPFRASVVLRPGEVVMLDSTPLDVMVVLADGVVGRAELTIALDVATRSVCAAVLRPMGTRAADAAVLLAQMATPMRMRPGWEKALALERSVVPYERLVSLDARLEGVAARPVIVPETVVVDQGRVFVSSSFLAACESLGVSVQPVPPANGPAKGQVERTFLTIRHRFSQYVAGYTGSDVTERGGAVEDEACWTLPQLRELWEEWLVADWQSRVHEGLRHPTMPGLALSPNEMWASLVGVCGYAPVPVPRLEPVPRCRRRSGGRRTPTRHRQQRLLRPVRRLRCPRRRPFRDRTHRSTDPAPCRHTWAGSRRAPAETGRRHPSHPAAPRATAPSRRRGAGRRTAARCRRTLRHVEGPGRVPAQRRRERQVPRAGSLPHTPPRRMRRS
ncbi:Transposase OS=Kitasatospora aureofaciens OX=1894 GN=GCM10010502_73930 PE=4 SV=1 [Kitasatospora aureofaciens]